MNDKPKYLLSYKKDNKNNSLTIQKAPYYVHVQLLEFAQKNRIVPALRLYLLLKKSCSGTIKFNDPRIRQIRENYFGSKQTYYNLFKILEEYKWIWYNKKSKIIHINSFARIQAFFPEYKTSRVNYSMDFLKEIKTFRAFVFAAIVSAEIDRIKKAVEFLKKKKKM